MKEHHISWWNWVLTCAASGLNRPMIIIGDFNVNSRNPRNPKWKWSEPVQKLSELGFTLGTPATGFSFFPLKDKKKTCLDHAFISKHFRLLRAEYLTEINGFKVSGSDSAISDHAVLIVNVVLHENEEGRVPTYA
jgi:endonuclease/exonuclease/phosphatase family metal-dependent hydrolase